MWRNLQLTSILLRRSTTRPTVFSSGGTHCAPPPATMRTCSTYCGTTTHVMSMIPRHQTAQPYATTSFASSIAMPYAVDAPNGDHDFQDLEESSGWVKRTILVASVTEDADAITEMHNAVLQGKRVYAVDAPDGEHDLEDMITTAYHIISFVILDLCKIWHHKFLCWGVILVMHQEEHLLGVNRIINQASVLEDPEKVSDAHQQFSELAATDFYNAKY